MNKQRMLALVLAALLSQGTSAADSPPAGAAPKVSDNMTGAFAAVRQWLNVYNYPKALLVAQDISRSPDASDYDRYAIDVQLVHIYMWVGDRAQSVGAHQRVLASRFYNGSVINRADDFMQMGKDQLALGDFEGAKASANAALALIANKGDSALAQLRQQSSQLLALAEARDSHFPEPVSNKTANPLIHTTLPQLENADRVCKTIAAHASADTLDSIAVPLQAIDAHLRARGGGDFNSGDETPVPAAYVDLFEDGQRVYVLSVFHQTYIQPFDSTGVLIDVTPDPSDSDIDEDPYWGGRKSLAQVEGHYYVLGRNGDQLIAAAAFDSQHTLRRVCSFKKIEASKGGSARYEARSQLDRLIEDAAQDSFSTSLITHIMTLPGLDAARLVLAGSRRKTDPIPLVTPPKNGSYTGENILVAAVEKGRTDILRYLLENGVDANLAASTEEQTALDVAARKGDLEISRLLLDHGAKADLPPYRGYTHSVLAQNFSSGSLELITLLLEHGADPNEVRPSAMIPWPHSPQLEILAAKISLLLQHGAHADPWVNQLFEMMAARDELANAEDLLDREDSRRPQDATFNPVRTAWVTNLLKNPARVTDDVADKLLREATAVRDSRPPAPDGPSSIIPRSVKAPVPTLPPDDGKTLPARTRDQLLMYAAADLQQRLPGFTVTPDLGQATVLVMKPTGAKLGHFDIQQQYRPCEWTQFKCRDQVARFLHDVARYIKAEMIPPGDSEIRLIAGTRASIERELAPRTASAPRVPMRPCLGELVCALVVDEKSMLRYLDEQDLKDMGLAEDHAYELAASQTRQSLRPTALLPVPTAKHPIEVANLDPYESRRALFPEDWAPMAARLQGELLVAVPAANLVVYGLGGSEAAIRRLRQFAEDAMPSAQRPLSATVFRWNGNGWSAVPEARAVMRRED